MDFDAGIECLDLYMHASHHSDGIYTVTKQIKTVQKRDKNCIIDFSIFLKEGRRGEEIKKGYELKLQGKFIFSYLNKTEISELYIMQTMFLKLTKKYVKGKECQALFLISYNEISER